MIWEGSAANKLLRMVVKRVLETLSLVDRAESCCWSGNRRHAVHLARPRSNGRYRTRTCDLTGVIRAL